MTQPGTGGAFTLKVPTGKYKLAFHDRSRSYEPWGVPLPFRVVGLRALQLRSGQGRPRRGAHRDRRRHDRGPTSSSNSRTTTDEPGQDGGCRSPRWGWSSAQARASRAPRRWTSARTTAVNYQPTPDDGPRRCAPSSTECEASRNPVVRRAISPPPGTSTSRQVRTSWPGIRTPGTWSPAGWTVMAIAATS